MSTVYRESVPSSSSSADPSVIEGRVYADRSSSIAPDMWRLPDEIESPHEDIRQYMTRRLIGQRAAINAMIGALDRSLVRTDSLPIANMLFLGPTGTGKTELTKALTGALASRGTPVNRLHLDCTALGQSHEAGAYLLGSPAGYVGYGAKAFFDPENFAEPGSDARTVLVLDEIEKANDALFKNMMPVMDEGKINLKNGSETWFSNTIIIGTSNVGAFEMSKHLKPSVGFRSGRSNESSQIEDIEAAAREGLQKRFSHMPEFLARFTDTVVFQPHTTETLGQVLDVMVETRNQQLRKRLGREIFLAAETKQYLVDSMGGDTAEGGRAIKKIYGAEIEEMFGKYVAAGHLPEGHCLYVEPDVSSKELGRSGSPTARKLAFFALYQPGLAAERIVEAKSESENSEQKQLTAEAV